jgi:hypothetical protein
MILLANLYGRISREKAQAASGYRGDNVINNGGVVNKKMAMRLITKALFCRALGQYSHGDPHAAS